MVVVVVVIHSGMPERERAAARTPPNDIDLSAAMRVDRREDAAAAAERRNAILWQGVAGGGMRNGEATLLAE